MLWSRYGSAATETENTGVQRLYRGILVALWIGFCSAAAVAVSFDYDASAPLMFSVDHARTDGAVKVADVSFRSGDALVRADLVVPERPQARMPGVLFVHWLGDPATTNRSEFLADALWLARRGVVSLLPDEPWSQLGWFEKVRAPATDAADSRSEVISLRRSLDALLAVPGVDAARVAYVGHDFGAMYGALLTAVDPRASCRVYMTPTVTFAEWFLLDTTRPPADPAAYSAELGAFDIPASLARAAGGASLLQFASNDRYVPPDKARAFAGAVTGEKLTLTYDAGHDLAVTAATQDRRAWLASCLKVPAQP